ncbi:MAG: hypothetical protein ILP10_06935 [Lachnospiraceae bacterium]|nr:hypothetical protein [Lachnospiraceae bacterium]
MSPATSANVVFAVAPVSILARLLPKFLIVALLPPDICADIIAKRKNTTTMRMR